MHRLVSQRTNFSFCCWSLWNLHNFCSLSIVSFDPIELLKNLYTMLDSLSWVTCSRIVWHLDLYFRQRHLSAAYWWCRSVLYITVEFGKVIRLESSRDPVGRPVAVVSPGSTEKFWSSPWLLSLVILSKAIIAVCIWTKKGNKMRQAF